MSSIVLKFLCIYLSFHFAYGAKILGIFHRDTYSNQQIGLKLLYELAARGHEVTAILPDQFAPKQPIQNFNVVKINVKRSVPGSTAFKVFATGTIGRIVFVDKMGISLTELALNQTSVRNLIQSNETFDMVIMAQVVNEAFTGFCHHYKAHCVIVSTIGASRWTNLPMGNPSLPSYVAENLVMYPPSMNFFQRLHNTYAYIFGSLFFHFYTLPRQNELLQKYFPGAPHINELYYNTSLMLLNSHVSLQPALPYVPNMINIGGYHIDPPKELPKDLKDYLDSAKDGAIYFSMGSHISSEAMPKDKLDIFVKVLSKLKQKVLWKFGGNLTVSENIKISKWFPQQEILAHPNVVLFISHGGLLSTLETIYHGKPIVGVPILGDQEMNIGLAEFGGFAKGLSLRDLSEEILENTLNEVLNNPKYTENVKRRSKIMHDEPMKPLDKAMFWIEYVLRHNGAPQLRTSVLDLHWYQLLCLDVFAFALIVLFLFLYITYTIFKIVINSIFKKRSKTNTMKSQKKTKAKKA